MRIRATKPEFWRSERIASVDWAARLVLKGLESYVDDNGVGKDDIALIVSDVFPRDMVRDPRDTLARVSEAISALENAGLVWRYESDGTRLIYISWWESVQRVDKPNKARFRRPDGTWDYAESQIASSSRESRETLAPVTEEQRNRGTEEQRNSLSSDKSDSTANLSVVVDDRFEEFWSTYDKKVGLKAARDKYRLALKKRGVTADMLIAAASEYIAYQRADGNHPQFTKNAATWLNGEHWNDERVARAAPEQPRSRLDGFNDLARRVAEREATTIPRQIEA